MAFKETILKISQAGELKDLPGHCKICASEVTSEDHVMLDPWGIGPPLYFCSAECLYAAEHIFDNFPKETLKQLEILVSQAESVTKIKH